ncbi:hypothetical protein [Moorena producens]|uniref:hypothetical protein n=1 Tax=Moorena producens TaxID=1155739 RepID=UPI0013142397|nr:hypothetical protein [Moorena producens]
MKQKYHSFSVQPAECRLITGKMPVLATTQFHQHAYEENIDHRQDACSTNNPIPPTYL